MQFKDGANVYTFDGQHVGHIDRVVLNPKTKEVTHLVIRKGFLFTEDKIIPFGLVASATEDRVALREGIGNLDTMPLFEETHYIQLDEDEWRTADYPLGMASALYWYHGGLGYSDIPPYRTETDQNIPEGTLALREGAWVMSSDNHHIGNVVQVFTEVRSDRITYFLVSEGFFAKDKKLIPVSWIRDIQEGEIHLSVGTSVLAKLHAYQEA